MRKIVQRLFLFVLLALPALAQVQVVCTPRPLDYSRSIFDHRTSRRVQAWGCVATNAGGQPAAVSEAALMGLMMRQGVSALSAHEIRTGAPEIKRRGKWATLGRVATYGAMIAAALAAGEVIDIGPAWGAAAGFASLNLPRFGEALAGREPSEALFEQLALQGEVALDAGKSAALTMFAAPLDNAKMISGSLDVAAPVLSQAEAPIFTIPGFEGSDPWLNAALTLQMAGD